VIRRAQIAGHDIRTTFDTARLDAAHYADVRM